MSDTFFARMDLAMKLVGGPLITAEINVDQVYARYQDGWGDPDTAGTIITPTEISHGPKGKPGPLFNHPHGGEAGYLSKNLTHRGPEFAATWAMAPFEEERPLVDAVKETAGKLGSDVVELAPRELDTLRSSAAVTVKENGMPVYFRPALVPRLSQAVLDALRRTQTRYPRRRR